MSIVIIRKRNRRRIFFKKVLRDNVTPFYLSRYLWAVRLPPQRSANARNLSGRMTACKSPTD
ncbi:hypothetical protein EKA14_11450 [Bacillus mycoides]|nr:hypothetical protein EKA14_11450 [Bacillus mycoides]